MEYLQKIEEWGGMLAAIEKGFIQKEIQESAYKYQKQIESKEQIIVGLNEYKNKEEKIHFRLYYPPKKLEKAQIKKLNLLKDKRSKKLVENRLQALREALEAEKNLLPYIMNAVKAMATLGEISSVLKEAYGTFKETTAI
jgi:methylmalonyl-CoA mutase N-terminal domain/subunit